MSSVLCMKVDGAVWRVFVQGGEDMQVTDLFFWNLCAELEAVSRVSKRMRDEERQIVNVNRLEILEYG